MVNRLHHRLKIMETQAQRLLPNPHFISVLIYPHHMAEYTLEGWLAEQLRCHCRPDCPGRRVGAVLPEKSPSAEAWSERYQPYARERTGYGRPQ
jgi:hypothetical protein